MEFGTSGESERPDGNGTARTKVRAVGTAAGVVCAVVIAVLLAAQLRVGLGSAGRRIGMFVLETPTGLRIRDVAPGLPADRAGFQVDDVVLQVSGVPLATTRDYNRVANGFRSGSTVDYVVQRAGEIRRVAVSPGVPFKWGDFVLSAVTTLSFLGLGFLALAQRLTDIRARLLFLFAVAVAVELSMPSELIGYAGLALLRTGAFYLLTGFQLGVELHLVSLTPSRPGWLTRRRWVVPAYYGAGALVALVAVAALLSEGVLGDRVLPWSLEQADFLVNGVVVPAWAGAVVLLLALPAIRFPLPEGRQQAALVLLGTLPWAGIVFWTSATNLFASGPPGWAESLWAPLLLCFPAAVFVAIYRYNLFDLAFVVRRGLIYTVLAGSLVLLGFALLGIGGEFLSASVGGGRGTVWLVGAATLVLGLLFAPLRDGVQRLVDSTFFPERRTRHQRLTLLARELAAQGKLPAMGKHLVTQLQEIFEMRGATLLLAEPKTGVLVTLASSPSSAERDLDQSFLLSPDDPGVSLLKRAKRPLPASQVQEKSASFGQRLRHFSAAVVVPLLTHEKLVGLLLVGEKSGGRRLPAEEIELLNLFSQNVAVVLENARLFESVTYENLTGLLRREAILQELERELERARRYRRPLTVGMADLDEFKTINDTHGHLVGDALLACVAQAIASGLRSSDAVGRYGGDEFLLVLPETALDGAIVVADKIRQLVESVRVLTDDGRFVATTVSIGLASLQEFDDPDRLPAEALISAADQNLFRAKQRGRNRVEPQLPVFGEVVTPSR